MYEVETSTLINYPIYIYFSRMERSASQERGIDVIANTEEGTRTYQVQTTVKLSREIQEANESDL